MDDGASSYRRFLDGDDSAFEKLLDLYPDSLIFFLNRYVQNITVAEDLAADAFVELIVHRHRYHFKNSLKTYLFMIGRSRALNYLKREAKFGAVPLETEAEPAIRENTEEIFLRDETKRELHLALDQLPADYRTALHLIYFAEMSYEEAGRVMQKNKKQMDNLVSRGKSALRSILKGDAIYEK